MTKIFYIDPNYIKYRSMWKSDRWKFSGDYVKLNMKLNKVGLNDEEQSMLDTMDRVINENNGLWTEGYDFDAESVKAKINFNKE
jgi:hypothetical protein